MIIAICHIRPIEARSIRISGPARAWGGLYLLVRAGRFRL